MSKDDKKAKKTAIARRQVTPQALEMFRISNAAILHMYDEAISVLKEGIKCGKTDIPQGLLSLMLYIDLLHGGAYSVPINERPYFAPDKTKSPYYAGALRNTDASQGLLGWLSSVLGIANAGPFVQEIYEDANVPHVFPKLISDDAYAVFMTILTHVSNTDIFKNIGTGVKTFVEAASTAADIPKKLAEAAKTVAEAGHELTAAQAEGLKALFPEGLNAETIKSLQTLLPIA